MNTDRGFGFLLGLTVGVAVGMLYAPKSGARLRRLVAGRTKDGLETIKDQAQDLWDTANQAVEKGRAGFAGTQESIKAVADAGKKAYRQATSH